MNLEQITLKGAAADPASGARPLALALGKELVARVLAAPEGGGRGLISLAGIVLEARVPAGLEAGRALRLQVTRADAEEVVVKIVSDAAEHLDGAAAGRVAGELALRGDPDLLRAALALADGPLWLPGGAAATVTVDPDGHGEGSGSAPADGGDAAFTLHCPHLGAIEVRLRVGPGGVRAGVVTPPGQTSELAESGLSELVAALERATGRPATAAVSPRAASTPSPTPPSGAFDGYA
jgi:Flagellar hook-length control protein FliK